MTAITPGLVSVIIPVHNRPGLVREAVASVLAQTYRPIEIIIIDDGSTDDTNWIIDELAMQNPAEFRVLHISNSGPGMARQAGLELAQGEFVQFLDSDDLLLPRKLEFQVAGLIACPGCALSYGKTREYVIGQDPMDTPTRRTGECHGTLFPTVLDGRLWATETPLFRRSALEKIGPWSSRRVLEDWEYECRLGALGLRLHYCDEFVSDHRHHADAREGLRWQHDDTVFKDLLAAHVDVLGHARAAGIPDEADEMQRFARNLFRLARDAGARGLSERADLLINLAAQIDSRRHGEYRLYKRLLSLLGYRRAATWGEYLARQRKKLARML